jgi:deoxyribodipyrimidine photo-lyase
VIFSKDEVIKDNGGPYTIFTPYSKKWLAKLDAFYLNHIQQKNILRIFIKMNHIESPHWKAWDLKKLITHSHQKNSC